MDPVSALALVLLLAVPTTFTYGVFKRAHANGRRLPSREDWHPQMPSLRAVDVPAGVRSAGRKTLTTVRTRTQRGAKQRRPLMERLVLPRRPVLAPPPSGKPASTPASKPAPPVPQRTPEPAPQEGPPMTTVNGSAAGDFMSATTRVIAEAEAGGIQSKARGGLVMGEGLKQLAAAMEQHARHLQEAGQYPAYVWEPWRQAAAMASGAATKVTEAGNAAAELARRPMGEANGQAPHRDELNKR